MDDESLLREALYAHAKALEDLREASIAYAKALEALRSIDPDGMLAAQLAWGD